MCGGGRNMVAYSCLLSNCSAMVKQVALELVWILLRRVNHIHTRFHIPRGSRLLCLFAPSDPAIYSRRSTHMRTAYETRSRFQCTGPGAIRRTPSLCPPVLPRSSSQHRPFLPVLCASASNEEGAGFADGSDQFSADLEDVAAQLKDSHTGLVKDPRNQVLWETVQDLKKEVERRKALVALLSGASAGRRLRRQPADEATQLWWQLLPQAEVKTVVLKVVAESGDRANVPGSGQAGEEGDVVQVPAAVLEEVLREVAEMPAAAQQGGAGDLAKVPAAAHQGEEGNQVEGCSVEVELLQLAGGTTFPGTEGPDGEPLNKLLLRKCYQSIVDQCMELTMARRRALVIGSPGAGKSYGTHELLRRLRLAGKTVVWQRKTAAHVLLLRPDGTVWRGDLFEFSDELLSPDTWYICDGMEPVVTDGYATTVLVTSPCSETLNEFVKQNHEELWVGRWKWTELLAARQYIWRTVTVADLKARVDTVGKLPRYALALNHWQGLWAVRRAIHACDARLIWLAAADIATAPPASSGLVHVVATDDCRFLGLEWASPSVADEVTAKLLMRDLDGMEAFVRGFKGEEHVGQLLGMQFQRVGGAWICAGGKLSHRSLDDQMEEPLRLPRQELCYVRELPEKLEADHYYSFAKATQPAVDAISVLSPKEDGAPMEVLMWQFTVRDTHPVAAPAVHKLLKLLEEQHKVVIRGMYFAVPADVYDQWKSRQGEKRDERLDVASQAACSATQQAEQQQKRGPTNVSQRKALLCDAVEALGGIKQFAVRIPDRGVSWRLQDSSA